MKSLKSLTLKNPATEIRQYQHRLIIVAVLIGFLLIALIARLAYLQIFQHTYYLTLSKQNLLSIAPIDPNRGLIYDRNGILIAGNTPAFSLDIAPDKIKGRALEKTIKNLSKIIHISSSDIDAFKKQLTQNRKFNSIPLKIKLTDDEMAAFAVNQYQFPGVSIQAHVMRYYPYSTLLEPVLGYVGRINAKELEKVDPDNYSASNYIGKSGVEKYDETLLHGTVGIQQVETSAAGDVVRSLQNKPAIAGNNLYLSIDVKLQAAIEKDLQGEVGGAIMLDAHNGEILAMVSTPSFDPNLFVTGINRKEYKLLADDPDRPLFNRILQGEFPSGSTVKPFYTLGALQDYIISPDEGIFDPGYFKLPHHPHIYHDDKKGGHGWVDLETAIIVSCDTYFFQLAHKMGIDRMDKILNLFGFGRPTNVDTCTERNGLVPSPEWKKRVHHSPWFEGDTISFGIGQGYFLVTPIQLATGLMRIVNKGEGYWPHFLVKTESPNGVSVRNPLHAFDKINMPEKNWDFVLNALSEVVSDPRGTGYWTGHTAKYTYGGKSGTAQVFTIKGNEKDKANLLPKKLRDHSWFMAFAPADNPKVILVVFLEHGGQGNAQKYARKILDDYFHADNNEQKKESLE